MSQKKKSMLLFLVVALLLVLSLVAVFFLNSHNEQGEIARIYQDGKLIREVSLTDVASPYEFQVEASDGGYNAGLTGVYLQTVDRAALRPLGTVGMRGGARARSFPTGLRRP